MGTSESNAGDNPAMDKHPIQGSHFMLMKPEISTGLMGLLARKQRLYFTLTFLTKFYFNLKQVTILDLTP